MVCNPRFHGGGYAQGLVNPAEVIVHEIERHTVSVERGLGNGIDHGQGKSVVALATDGLDFRGGDTLLGGEPFVEAADALNVNVTAAGVQHLALAYHIVGDDDTPWAR